MKPYAYKIVIEISPAGNIEITVFKKQWTNALARIYDSFLQWLQVVEILSPSGITINTVVESEV